MITRRRFMQGVSTLLGGLLAGPVLASRKPRSREQAVRIPTNIQELLEMTEELFDWQVRVVGYDHGVNMTLPGEWAHYACESGGLSEAVLVSDLWDILKDVHSDGYTKLCWRRLPYIISGGQYDTVGGTLRVQESFLLRSRIAFFRPHKENA